MKFIYSIGEYTIFLLKVFSKPEKWKLFRKNVLNEMITLGVSSIPIVAIISIFMGAALSIQTAANTGGGIIPLYTVGFAVRESVILEFSPTIVALILVGKIGSSISSQLGTMRVTEQIDAIEIMGINSASFLVQPKIIALVLLNPILITLSIFLSIGGGFIAGVGSGHITPYDYEYGLQYDFIPFHYTYSMIKSLVFGFIITSVPAYFGYYVKGGSVEVAKSSTQAVVQSSIAILIINYLLTQLLLM